MSLTATYNLVAGILLIVRAAFIAPPAWSWWTRNLVLVRIGVRTTGRYQGQCQVAFFPETGRQVTFSTWRQVVSRTNIGEELPVLYHPANPGRAEIMTSKALWNVPLSNLLLSATLIVTATLLFLGVNLALAIFLMVFEWPLGYVLAKLALYALYPASRLGVREKEVSLPGSGRSHSRSRRRWQRQLAWKEQPYVPELKDLTELVPPTMVPGKARKARDQLLHDMMSPSDLLEGVTLSEKIDSIEMNDRYQDREA